MVASHTLWYRYFMRLNFRTERVEQVEFSAQHAHEVEGVWLEGKGVREVDALRLVNRWNRVQRAQNCLWWIG